MKAICGVRPTEGGRLHLGHYFSVIKPALKDYGCIVLVADLHAPNCRDNDVVLTCETLERFGLNRVVVQSVEWDQYNKYSLFDSLLMRSNLNQLMDRIQYKQNPNGDMNVLTYPVRMAADINGYGIVYVGRDQKEHIEIARKLLIKIGSKAPHPVYTDVTIYDLRHPEFKMSKSRPEGCLYLDDSPEDIKEKVRRANYIHPNGLQTLNILCDLVSIDFDLNYAQTSKDALADKLIEFLGELTCQPLSAH